MTDRTVLPILRRAREGNAEAQISIGRLYLEGGSGLPRSPRAAYLWLEKAARQGCEDAIRLIGEAVPASAVSDLASAAPFYERAAAMGCARAQRLAANRSLTDPNGQDRDAARMFEQAAEHGDRGAQVELACLYTTGEGVPENRERANYWYEKAAAQNSLAARQALAEFYWSKNDPAAVGPLVPLAEQGDIQACHRLGVLLVSMGRVREAVGWLRRAADSGLAEAQFAFGLLFAAHGGVMENGVPHSYKKAAHWLEKAALQGMAQASFELHRLYGLKTFSQRDPVLARRHLEQAAEKNHVHAQYLLGLALCRRSGDAQSDVASVQWLSRAAAKEHIQAQALLLKLCPQPPRCTDEIRMHRANAVRLLARSNLAIATRLELAAEFGLARYEALMIVPASADRGECLVLDFREQVRKSRRRIVLVHRGDQRELLDRARRILTANPPFPGDLPGSFRDRCARFEEICRANRVTPEWFDHPAANEWSKKRSIGPWDAQ